MSTGFNTPHGSGNGFRDKSVSVLEYMIELIKGYTES